MKENQRTAESAPSVNQPYRETIPTMTYEGALALADAVMRFDGTNDVMQVLMVEAVLSLAPTGNPGEDLDRQDKAAELVRELLKRTFAFEAFCDALKDMLADPEKRRDLYRAVYDEDRKHTWLSVGIKAE